MRLILAGGPGAPEKVAIALTASYVDNPLSTKTLKIHRAFHG
jgi:hypothetical protein